MLQEPMATSRDDHEGTPIAGALARPARPDAGSDLWARLAFGLALALLASVLVIAARSEPAPAPDRLTRRMELLELIAAEQARTELLAEQADALADEVAQFEAQMETGTLGGLQEKIDTAAAPAGLTAVRGPGLAVTLSDSVQEYVPDDDPNDYLIHEQDLQAVINALWAGDAEAMTVNGQRVLATTAIRCVGNTLLMHGQVYMPPYEIAAIGDVRALQVALDRDPAVGQFRTAAEQHELGYEVAVRDAIQIPAFEGLAPLEVARPTGMDLG